MILIRDHTLAPPPPSRRALSSGSAWAHVVDLYVDFELEFFSDVTSSAVVQQEVHSQLVRLFTVNASKVSNSGGGGGGASTTTPFDALIHEAAQALGFGGSNATVGGAEEGAVNVLVPGTLPNVTVSLAHSSPAGFYFLYV